MSVQQNQDAKVAGVAGIDEKAVADYLQSTPGFFNERDELLSKMMVVHTTGASVSLIERQVAILREQSAGYQQQLAELVEVARVNDNLMLRMQELVLALLESNDLASILALIEQSLTKDFNADAITLCLFADPTTLSLDSDQIGKLRVCFASAGDELIQVHQEMFAKGEPRCGVLDAQQQALLFGDEGEEIHSVAQLPLVAGENSVLLGMLAIGSSDASRFSAGMGTVFLKYLGALVSRKIAPHLPLDGS